MPTPFTIHLTSAEVLRRAEHKAQALGLSLSKYVSDLIVQGTQPSAPVMKIFPA